MAGPTIEEVNFFKGMSTHPNPISVGTGTFRDILNGWFLRDGVVDMRPGFDVDAVTPRAPGLSMIPGTTTSSFAGIKTLGSNTFVQNDGRLFWYEPNGLAGMVAISAGGTLNTNTANAIAINSRYIVIANQFAATTANVLSVFSRSTGELVASGPSASIEQVWGVAIDPVTDKIWIASQLAHRVRGLTFSGGTITVTDTIGTGGSGLTAGTPLSGVQLGYPYSLCVYNDGITNHVYVVGNYYVYDCNITTNTGAVIAGVSHATGAGYVNATGASARFGNPTSLGFFNSDPTKLYVCDEAVSAIRLVTTAGVVTTFAGPTTNIQGWVDGVGTAARFKLPFSLCCVSATGQNPDGSAFYGLTEDTIFVADTYNFCIRNIKRSTASVSTFVGLHGSAGVVDGNYSSARFAGPMSLGFDSDEVDSKIARLFVIDYPLLGGISGSQRIRCIDAQNPITATNGIGLGTSSAVVSTFAGGEWYDNTAVPPSALNLRQGFMGGIYNYNALTPAFTAVPGTTYNPAMRLFEYAGSTYFNSARGAMAMDLPATYTTSQIGHYAGAPQGYDLTLTLVPVGAGTLLVADHAAAYRIVWGYRTAGGRPIVGAPSSRFVITNPSGAGNTKNVQLVSQIPIGATPDWSYQIYRTPTVNTVGSTIDPGDTMYLAYEANLTIAQLIAGTITVTDSTPDSVLGQDLYTNATQETLSQANNQPPICLDMCLFGENAMAIYANTINKQRMFVNLVGLTGFTGSPTITFTFADGLNNFTLTGNSTTAADGVFVYTTGGTPASNIDATARSIVYALNTYTGNRRLRAFYVSPYDGTPGQIAVEENFVGGQEWAITSSAGIGGSFAPTIPTSGSTYLSVPDVSPNGLYVGKLQNPDAVPLVNKFTVGDSSESIRRVLPLRESVMVIKECSVWRLTGTTPESISITLLDNTVVLRSDESCCVLNNEVYALTTQGIVAISDNGVRIVSRPVEWQLDQMLGTLAAPLDLNGLVAAYGSDDYRTYFLSTYNTTENFCWDYNVLSNSWSRWDLIFQAITVRNGRIIGAVLSPTAQGTFELNTPWVLQQLNQQLFANPLAYHDGGGLCTVATLNNTTKVVTVGYSPLLSTTQPFGYGQWQYPLANQPTIGWIIGQGLVTADDGAGNLTLSDTTGLTAGQTATVLRPINFSILSNPHNGGASFKLKQWGDVFFCLENQNLLRLSAGFITNNQKTTDVISTQVKQVLQHTSTPASSPYFKEQIFKLSTPKAVAGGNLLQWQLNISQANVLVSLKAVGIETRGIDSAKGQQ